MSEVLVVQTDAHLAANVELTYVGDNSTPCAKFTAISNRVYKDASGEKHEVPTRIRWTTFGPAAENHAKMLCKGSHVNVFGRVENNDYQDKNTGDTVYSYQYISDRVEYLDTKEESEARRRS
jgi:single-strand DNA-binding protein